MGSDDMTNGSTRSEAAPTGAASPVRIGPVAVPPPDGGGRHPIQAATLGGAGVSRRMPGDLSIAVRPATGSDTTRADRERGARTQSMRGFEDTYTDIVDYIVQHHAPDLGRPGRRLHL